MSTVTDIIILCPPLEDKVPALNEWLISKYNCTLKEISGFSGGNKVMQNQLWTTAINGFDTMGFLAMLREIEWSCAGDIQVLIKEEHEEQFKMYAGPAL